jgi:PAS domain S-box-containing protein
MVYGKAFDLTTQHKAQLPARFGQLTSADPLMAGLTTKKSISGVVELPSGPMLIAAHGISNSEGNAPMHGALLMGRYLDARALAQLETRTQLAFTIHRLGDTSTPADVVAAAPALEQSAPLLIQPSGDRANAYALLDDLDQRENLVLRVMVPRNVYTEGLLSINYVMGAFVVAGLLFAAVLLGLLERTVLARLAQLTANVERIGTSGDLLLRVPSPGADELGRLAMTFNRTLATLAEAQAARAQLYSEARGSAQRNRAIIDAIPDAMYRFASDGRYLDAKPHDPDLLRRYPDGLLGKTAAEVLSPELAAQVRGCIEQALATQSIQVVEITYPAGNQPRDFEARFVVSGADEVLAIVRDITDRKQVERLKSEFIATVSHELRTPLTAIRGSLGLIARGVTGELPAQTEAMVSIAYKNSERLLGAEHRQGDHRAPGRHDRLRERA